MGQKINDLIDLNLLRKKSTGWLNISWPKMDEVRLRFFEKRDKRFEGSGSKEKAESLQKTEAHSYLDYEGARELSGWSRDFLSFPVIQSN